MKNINNTTIQLRFAEIKTLNYSQFDLMETFNPKTSPLAEFQSNFQFRVLEEDEKIACLTSIKVLVLETKEEFAEIKVETFFDIRPFKEIIKKHSENKFEIPNIIMHNIASISISTIRGILFEKLKGTIMQNEIYPLVDLSKTLKQEEIEKNNE